jgi:RNA-binding protein YhbY
VFISYKKIRKLNKNIDKFEIRIGKKGLTLNLIKEIKDLSRKKRAIKVRVLKNSPLQVEEIIELLKREKELLICQNRGRTFIVVNSNYLSEEQNLINKEK